MAYFIKIALGKPGEAKYVNVDAIAAIASTGVVSDRAKLYMVGGEIYESLCSFEELLTILQSRKLLAAE